MKNLWIVSRVLDTDNGIDVTPVKVCKKRRDCDKVMVEDKAHVENLFRDGLMRNISGHRYRVQPVPVV